MSDSSFERRKSLRANVSIPVEVRSGRDFAIHSTRDVSSGGLFLDRAIPARVGSRVELTFTLPGTHGDSRVIRCAGEIANVPNAHGYGMGVRFFNLAPADEKRLNEFAQSIANGANSN